MSHDSDDTSHDEGPVSRGVPGTHGQSVASIEHDESPEPTDADADEPEEAIEAELEAATEQGGPLGAIGASFSGPLPPASILRGYEELVPGSAANIIGAHVRNENARAGALTRLTRAESFGVIVGTLGAQILTVGGLAAGVILVVSGYPAESLLGFVPAAVSSTALVVSAVRGNKAD